MDNLSESQYEQEKDERQKEVEKTLAEGLVPYYGTVKLEHEQFSFELCHDTKWQDIVIPGPWD